MIPVLPPLEPGGSYWDTTFLQSLMQSLVRREKTNLLDMLVVSAYAWTHRQTAVLRCRRPGTLGGCPAVFHPGG